MSCTFMFWNLRCILYHTKRTLQCMGQNTKGVLGYGDEFVRAGSQLGVQDPYPSVDLGTGAAPHHTAIDS